MHGRLKVRSTEEQAERRRLEREKKLKMYQVAMKECLGRVASAQYDEDTLKLSEELLMANNDIQTLWNLRRNALEAKEKRNDVTDEQRAKQYVHELSLTETCLKKNFKSYGTWLHRQWCLKRANTCGLTTHAPQLAWHSELKLCDTLLAVDERNFHCWKHRFYVIEQGALSLLDELTFTHDKICSNFSNYSAWHYRSKLLSQLYAREQIDVDAFRREVELVENALYTDPSDQSAWIYQKWLLQEHQRSNVHAVRFHLADAQLTCKFARNVDLNVDLFRLTINDTKIVPKWSNENGGTEASHTWTGKRIFGYINK